MKDIETGENGFFLHERGSESVLKRKKDGSPMLSATYDGATSAWQIVIDAARREKQLSLQKLADKLGYTKYNLWRYLRNKSGLPPISGSFNVDKEHRKISRILDIPKSKLDEAYAATIAGDEVTFKVDDSRELFEFIDRVDKLESHTLPADWIAQQIEELAPATKFKPQTPSQKNHSAEWRKKVLKYRINDRAAVYEPFSPFQILIHETAIEKFGSASEFCNALGISMKRFITMTQNELGYPHPKTFDPDEMIPKLSKILNIDKASIENAYKSARLGRDRTASKIEYDSRLSLLWSIRPLSNGSNSSKKPLLNCALWIASI